MSGLLRRRTDAAWQPTRRAGRTVTPYAGPAVTLGAAAPGCCGAEGLAVSAAGGCGAYDDLVGAAGREAGGPVPSRVRCAGTR
ncbi:hypothetical protein [Streptomyces sp. SM11]|uniref:hypothetical protein n=1 Tax=Streptomyces sp. SM11 TaxID=565557 RepID=UPI0015E1B667|nr:hypothetical protein [Streptomyces sp. SM11]